jgi:hypothetical protein
MSYVTNLIQIVNHVIIYAYTIANVIMGAIMKDTFLHYATIIVAYVY